MLLTLEFQTPTSPNASVGDLVTIYVPVIQYHSQHGDGLMSENENEKRNTTQKLYKLNTHKQTGDKSLDDRQLKDRFLETVVKGELGSIEISGAIVTLKEFKSFFSDISMCLRLCQPLRLSLGGLGQHIQNFYFEFVKALI